jgi:hypothetical protein
VFKEGKPVFVVELKTTAGRTDIIYDDQKAQASIYGLLLELMGFDCSALKIVIARYRRDAIPSPERRREFLNLLIPSLLTRTEGKFAEKTGGLIMVHVLTYSAGKAGDTVRKMKGYWLNQREPIPTNNPNKCRKCPHNESCPSSLWKSDTCRV